MSFSGEIFDGTAVNLGEGKAYGKLKRCVQKAVYPPAAACHPGEPRRGRVVHRLSASDLSHLCSTPRTQRAQVLHGRPLPADDHPRPARRGLHRILRDALLEGSVRQLVVELCVARHPQLASGSIPPADCPARQQAHETAGVCYCCRHYRGSRHLPEAPPRHLHARARPILPAMDGGRPGSDRQRQLQHGICRAGSCHAAGITTARRALILLPG